MDNILTENVLIESSSARTAKLSNYNSDQAFEALNKAKALLMASWQSERWATTEQMAEFYQVPVATVQQAARRHKQEFQEDGLSKKGRKELKALPRQVADLLSVSPNAGSVVLWNPRAALRLGMLLRDSEVAKQVRSLILNVVEVVPKQSEHIKELELRLQLATAEKEAAQAQQKLLAARQTVAQAMPEPQAAMVLGCQLVEKVEHRDRVIDEKTKRVWENFGITKICQRHDIKTSKGKPDTRQAHRILKAVGMDDPRYWEKSIYVGEMSSFKTEYLPELDQRIREYKERQLYLGEDLI